MGRLTGGIEELVKQLGDKLVPVRLIPERNEKSAGTEPRPCLAPIADVIDILGDRLQNACNSLQMLIDETQL